jgi:hypothetical protein
VFDHDGVSFEFPSSWVYFEVEPFAEVPEAWAFAVSPDNVSNMIALRFLPEQLLTEIGMTPDDFIDALIGFEESEGVTLRSDPSTIQVGSEDGTLIEFEGVTGSRTGQPLLADQVWVFTDTGAYFLMFRYLPADEGAIRPVWERALNSMQGLDQ